MQKDQIQRFPITFYAIVMGFGGLTISLQKAEELLHIPQVVGLAIGLITTIIFLAITFLYLYKLFFFYNEVKKEFEHPIKISFFATFSISLLLLSIIYLPIHIKLSQYLWVIGVLIHFVLFLAIMTTWMHHEKYKIIHMNPSWFIPAVGNILIPLAGTVHANREISWCFFSIGMMLWLILMVIFVYRLFFHEALPDKLLPTLFILIAPPSVAVLAYFKLTETFNEFVKILYYFALFITILLFTQIKYFSTIKFYLSWWAYTFPIAAITVASALMFKLSKLIMFKYAFIGLLSILILLIVLLIVLTINEIIHRRICTEEN